MLPGNIPPICVLMAMSFLRGIRKLMHAHVGMVGSGRGKEKDLLLSCLLVHFWREDRSDGSDVW